MTIDRDLRDPQKLGEALLSQRDFWEGYAEAEGYDLGIVPPLSVIFDYAEEHGYLNVPDYDNNESLATVTAKEYKQELKERAVSGDRYAKSLLEGKQWDEPGE